MSDPSRLRFRRIYRAHEEAMRAKLLNLDHEIEHAKDLIKAGCQASPSVDGSIARMRVILDAPHACRQHKTIGCGICFHDQ